VAFPTTNWKTCFLVRAMEIDDSILDALRRRCHWATHQLSPIRSKHKSNI
jgi:hypothetical protein